MANISVSINDDSLDVRVDCDINRPLTTAKIQEMVQRSANAAQAFFDDEES